MAESNESTARKSIRNANELLKELQKLTHLTVKSMIGTAERTMKKDVSQSPVERHATPDTTGNYHSPMQVTCNIKSDAVKGLINHS
jgi:hypothetical protein